jgi:hypothetical protein
VYKTIRILSPDPPETENHEWQRNAKEQGVKKMKHHDSGLDFSGRHST